MATSEARSVLQRKMDAVRKRASEGGRSAAGALRLAMARSADDLFDLALTVIGVIQTRMARDELASFLSDDRMQVLLDGPDGQLGAVSLDRVFLTALIQQQTMGRLTGAPPDDRPFTGTDAALVAPLLDAALERAAELAEKPNDVLCLAGFRFGARAEDARAVTLAMEVDQFRVFDLTLEFAQGSTQTVMSLILPESEETGDLTGDDPAPRNTSRLGRVVETARADLTAVICRMRLPLANLSGMQPGDLVPLVQDDLEHTDLITIEGKKVSSGRLGQIGGLRAVRLNETHPPIVAKTEPEEFAADIGARIPAAPLQEIEENDEQGTFEKIATQMPDDLPETSPLDETEADDAFLALTPEQAAVEISALAGLPMDDSEPETLPVPIE